LGIQNQVQNIQLLQLQKLLQTVLVLREKKSWMDSLGNLAIYPVENMWISVLTDKKNGKEKHTHIIFTFQIWTMFLYLVTGYYHCLSGHTPVSACTTSVNLTSLAVDDSLLHHLASRMVKTRYSESYCQWTFHVYNFSRCFYVRKCFPYFHYCSLSYFFYLYSHAGLPCFNFMGELKG